MKKTPFLQLMAAPATSLDGIYKGEPEVWIYSKRLINNVF
jgi:hypothetical protein